MTDTYNVGDELKLLTGPDTWLYAVVTNIDNDWVTCFLANGRNTCFKVGFGKWRKTGRNFSEVETLLKKIGAATEMKED